MHLKSTDNNPQSADNCAAKKFKIFVINLQRSTERMSLMKSELEKLGLEFERFNAVDGRALKQCVIDKYYSEKLNKKKYFTPLNKGEIGCYISHLKVCQEVLDKSLDYAIVLEDDIAIKPEFAQIPQVINNISQDWDWIKLSSICREKKVRRRLPAGSYNSQKFEYVWWNKPPIGMQAYAVSFKGAEKLLKKRPPFFRPIDVDLQYPWETQIEIMGIMPFSVKVRELSSDIGHTKPKAHYPLARTFYKFKYLRDKILNQKAKS